MITRTDPKIDRIEILLDSHYIQIRETTLIIDHDKNEIISKQHHRSAVHFDQDLSDFPDIIKKIVTVLKESGM